MGNRSVEKSVVPADTAAVARPRIVGIGASAGGLGSFSRILAALPADLNMAVVLLQHLDPSQHSMLADILRRFSAMPVVEVRERTEISPGHVYVMPSNMSMRLTNGALALTRRRKTAGPVLPIDTFLESLSADSGPRAIGIVLSGTGSDGVAGLASIRAAGGLTFVEDPATAEYDGMPKAAIDAGVADLILSPEDIAAHLVRLSDEPAVKTDSDSGSDSETLAGILRLIDEQTGLDLTRYRRTTLLRRIQRRMLLDDASSMGAYLDMLRRDTGKVDALYRDVLVNTTQFFRDPVVLAALTQHVFPELVKQLEPRAPFRVWVAGCSKGQEAYSILMSLVEFLDQACVSCDVQLFASDVNEEDIEYARAGVYPESIERDVSPERLARFFQKVPNGYRIRRAVREKCVFAVHDITQDPPFSKMDLVTFRNVLIYMERPLQEHVLDVLHYALKPNGFLLLGTAESIGSDTSRFEVVDKKAKIYRRKPGPAKLSPRPAYPSSRPIAVATQPSPPTFDVFAAADRVVHGGYQPAGFVLSHTLDILQFRGDVGHFLAPTQGPPDFRLSRMVAPGLSAAIEAAVREAVKTKASAKRTAIAAEADGCDTDVEVVPFDDPAGASYYIAMLRRQSPRRSPKDQTALLAKKGDAEEMASLRGERDEIREQLSAVIAEREAANLDLRTTGERLQASNEELRTINEELQTAQEELQSTNEELTTLNDELRNRNTELVQLADDLSNVIDGAEIPMLILSKDLRIRRFTPQAQSIVNIMPSDVGRPLTDLSLKLDIGNIGEHIADVLRTGDPMETDVRGPDALWRLMRIRPYRTTEGSIDGAVVAFIDVDELRSAKEAAETSRAHAEAVIDTVSQPLVTLDDSLHVAEVNRAFGRMFTIAPDEAVGAYFFDLREGLFDVPELRDRLRRVADKGGEFAGVVVDGHVGEHGRLILRVSGCMVSEEAAAPAILVALEDVTVATRRQQLSSALNDINMVVASSIDFECVLGRVLRASSDAIGADSAALLLKQDEGWVMKGVHGLDDQLLGTVLDDDDLPVAAHSMRTGEPLLVPELPAAARFGSSLGIEVERRSVLLVPILFRDELVGSLSFHFHRLELTFTEAEDDFARRLGAIMGFALENAELYATQREIADTLQAAIVTLPRKLPGIEFGYVYQSATKAAAVGGDFFDLIELDHGRVGILIGDVSGKGVRAATLTALVKNTIRALAYEQDSPAAIVSKANEVILKGTKSSIFVTLLFCILDASTGALVYCNAGHTTGLVRKAGGAIEPLEVHSPLAGAFDEVLFDDGRTTLADGDVLVVYTDGVTEARRAEGLYGEKRLGELIQGLSHVGPRKLPKEILRQVREWAGEKLSDDIAIIAIARRP